MGRRRDIVHSCNLCGRGFTCSGHLTRHMRTHDGSRPYACAEPVCGKSYGRAENLRRHELSHNPENRKFACDAPACSKRFSTKQKLNRHRALHARPTPFECADCGESFRKKNLLAAHRTVHTGTLPYPCPEEGCGKEFLRPVHLRKHQVSMHSGKKLVCCEAKCLGTGLSFTKFSDLQRHIKREHPQGPRRYKCPHCGRLFASNSALSQHKKTHEAPAVDRLVYKCDFAGCQAWYTSTGSLSNHVLSKHKRKDSFVCSVCEATFSYLHVLKNHVRTRHSEGSRKDRVERTRATAVRVESSEEVGDDDLPSESEEDWDADSSVACDQVSDDNPSGCESRSDEEWDESARKRQRENSSKTPARKRQRRTVSQHRAEDEPEEPGDVTSSGSGKTYTPPHRVGTAFLPTDRYIDRAVTFSERNGIESLADIVNCEQMLLAAALAAAEVGPEEYNSSGFRAISAS